jgi:hypothetical protein
VTGVAWKRPFDGLDVGAAGGRSYVFHPHSLCDAVDPRDGLLK